ncbi:MAG TPA: TetR/AcrR family transcriptional regulator [Candidatus Paceibacterota bacterium]|nr:TetR/AcrR family transcriptional regulator [Candidatus Paceibacterota bacterium]
MSIAQCIGRPRDTSRDVVIEKAAIELLREVGYEQLTIESVATRAQVSKATIYRRWKNKAALITDSVHHYAFCKAPAIDTGSLRGDLIGVISEKVKTMKSADGQLIAGLMCMARTDTDLASVLTQSLADYASAAHAAMFDRAVARGEISKDAKRELILQIVPAVISFRVFMSHQSVSRKFVENFVDDVLIPVIKHTNK